MAPADKKGIPSARSATEQLADKRCCGAHPGLLLERYLIRQSDHDERRRLLDSAFKAIQSESLHSLYAEAFQRWRASFQDKPSQSCRLATAGRLIVGLGAESVLETGLRIHHTYGVPFIPGSALKGLASHYCAEVWGQRLNSLAPGEAAPFRRGEKSHSLLFGSTDDSGVIVFEDAWIAPQSLKEGALRPDVMTPHHPGWQKEGDAPPTDFDSPNPISFLSVAGTFEIRLLWSGPKSGHADAWTKLAMKILTEALAEWGVGGKTSSGYGRLVFADSVSSNRQSPLSVAAQPKALPKPGEKVEAQLLEERTKRGGWRAMHAPSKLSGPIQNSSDVPSDKNAGAMLELIVASATERGLDFRYPTPMDEARAQRPTIIGQGGRGRGGRRR